MKQKQLNHLVHRAVANGLIKFSPPRRPFPGRRGGTSTEFILDIRGASANVELRTLLLSGLLGLLGEFNPQATIAGISRGGVMFGAQLALISGRSFVTVLPEGPRVSGLCRAVEGDVSGKKVVLFDNVATSGSSIADAASEIVRSGGNVAGAIVVATYGAPPKLDFPLLQLFDVCEIVSAACDLGMIGKTRHDNISRSIQS